MRYSMRWRVHATLLALFAMAMIVGAPVQAVADDACSFAELSAGGCVAGATVGETDGSASLDNRSVLASAGGPELKAGESTVTTEDGSVLKWKVDSSTTAKITGYVTLTADLVVPSEIEGRSVIALGDMVVGGSPIPNSTFADNTVLGSVHLPDSLKILSGLDFSGCANLKSVRIPSGVLYIGMGCFADCAKLSDIALPSALRSIETTTFMGCASLTSVDIPAQVSSIGSGAFGGCSSLASVSFAKGLTQIGGGAFEGTAIEEVELPNTLRTIQATAFRGCNNLAIARVPASVRTIGDAAFDSQVLILTDATGADAVCTWARSNGNTYIRGTLGDYHAEGIERQTFSGEPIEPEIVLENYKGDVFPAAYVSVDYSNNLHAGRASFKASSPLFDDTVSGTFYIDERDIADYEVTCDSIPDQVRLDRPVTPSVNLALNGRVLRQGTDYTLVYSNNNEVGRAEVSIRGKGDFDGSRTEYFNIAQKKVTISFVTNGGTLVDDITIDYGDSSSLFYHVNDSNVVRKYSELSGWYTDPSFKNLWNLIYDKPQQDMVLYAKWVPVGGAYPYGFTDVFDSTPHVQDIWWLAYSGISEGWSESYDRRSFRPYAIVARSDMAAFLYRLAGEPAFNEASAPRFSDVNSSTPHRKAILWLASQGISKGWDNGDGTFSFRPYTNVARADMAAFLYRLAGSPEFDESSVTAFRDVDASTPHREAILWLASSGVSKGWDEGGGAYSFRPYLEVARCDMAAFLHRMDENGLVDKG